MSCCSESIVAPVEDVTATSAADPAAYLTRFTDRVIVLAEWTPQAGCAHCGKGPAFVGFGGDNDECTNMTLSATSFGAAGMTHTTRALPASTPTLCRKLYSTSM